MNEVIDRKCDLNIKAHKREIKNLKKRLKKRKQHNGITFTYRKYVMVFLFGEMWFVILQVKVGVAVHGET